MSGLDGYFVGEDANSDVWLWRERPTPGGFDVPSPVLSQVVLRDDPELWDAIVALIEDASTPAHQGGLMGEPTETLVNEGLRHFRAVSDTNAHRYLAGLFGRCQRPTGHAGSHRLGGGWAGWACAAPLHLDEFRGDT